MVNKMGELNCIKDNKICEYYNECKSHTEKIVLKFKKYFLKLFKMQFINLIPFHQLKKLKN